MYKEIKAFLCKYREKRRMLNDLKDDDNSTRARGRRRRQKTVNNSELPLLVLLVVGSGAAWFWSLFVNYNTTAHTILFSFSIMLLGIVSPTENTKPLDTGTTEEQE